MGIMRTALLWASRNQTLRQTLPKYGFVRRAVRRFMPGEGLSDALVAAERLRTQGMSTIVTHLGENVSHESEAAQVTEHYLDALKRIHDRGLDCPISIKLTHLGLDLGEELCYAHLRDLLERARELQNVVWIDMESSEYVDRTLSLFTRARTDFDNVGVCLQSYLRRTGEDLKKLLPMNPSIRLVKGAYAEPKHIVYRKKKEVDESFFALAQELLKAAADGRVRIGMGTHDRALLSRIGEYAAQNGLPKESYEIQMLYGIQREQQLSWAKLGYRVRVLISYGSFWFPWYMRRLAERPANVLFVMRNIIAQ